LFNLWKFSAPAEYFVLLSSSPFSSYVFLYLLPLAGYERATMQREFLFFLSHFRVTKVKKRDMVSYTIGGKAEADKN
jgi:hypothetical protein